MIEISKVYKYIVLILLVFLFAVIINKVCKSSKETLDNPPLNRTFNADQYLKSLHIETDDLSVKQKFIDAITSPSITPYIKYLDNRNASEIIRLLFFEPVTQDNKHFTIEQIISDYIDPSQYKFIDDSELDVDVTSINKIELYHELNTNMDNLTKQEINKFGSYFGINKTDTSIFIPSSNQFKKNILENRYDIINMLKEPVDKELRKGMMLPKADASQYITTDEFDNIISKEINSNDELIETTYTLNESLIENMQLSNIPSYLKYRIRNNRNYIGNTLSNIINSYALVKEWGWKRVNTAGLIISDTTCTPEIVYIMTKYKLDKIINLDLHKIRRDKYFLEETGLSKDQSKEVFDLLLNINKNEYNSDATSVDVEFKNHEGIKVFNEENQEKTTEKVQTVFEIINNNIQAIDMFKFIKPKSGVEIDMLGFPLEQTDCYPEGETSFENIVENFEYKQKLDYDNIVPILSNYSINNLKKNNIKLKEKERNNSTEQFSNNYSNLYESYNASNDPVKGLDSAGNTNVTNSDGTSNDAFVEKQLSYDDAEKYRREHMEDDISNLVPQNIPSLPEENIQLPAPVPYPYPRDFDVELNTYPYYSPKEIGRGYGFHVEDEPIYSNEKGPLKSGEFIYYESLHNPILYVSEDRNQIDPITGEAKKIYIDPKKIESARVKCANLLNDQIVSDQINTDDERCIEFKLLDNTETKWKIKIFKEISSQLDPDDPMQADLAILNTVIANIVSNDNYLMARNHQLNKDIYNGDFTINGVGGISMTSENENEEKVNNDSGKIRYHRLKTIENENDSEADVIGHIGIIDNFYPGNDDKFNLPLPIKFKDPYPFEWPNDTQQRQWAFDNFDIVLKRMIVNVNNKLVDSVEKGPLLPYQTEMYYENDFLGNEIKKYKIITEGERIVGPLGNIIVIPTLEKNVDGTFKKVYYDKNTNKYEVSKVDITKPISWKAKFLLHRFYEIRDSDLNKQYKKYKKLRGDNLSYEDFKKELQYELVLLNKLIITRIEAQKKKKVIKMKVVPTNTVELVIKNLSFYDEIAPLDLQTEERDMSMVNKIYHTIAEFFTDTNIISSCSQPIVSLDQIANYNRKNLASLYENNLLRIEKILIRNKCFLRNINTGEEFKDVLKNKVYFCNYSDIERLQRAINSSFNTYIEPSDEIQDIVYHGSRLKFMIDNKYPNKEDFISSRVNEEDQETFRLLLEKIYNIKWNELNLDTDTRDMEIENKIYNYYDEIIKEYVPGLKLSDLNFLYKYVTLDEYLSMPLDLKIAKMDTFFHEQEELIDENIGIVRKRIAIDKITKEIDDWLKLNPSYEKDDGTPTPSKETFSNNIKETLNSEYTDGHNTREELINLRYGEVMRNEELAKNFVNEQEILDVYNYQTARSVINLLRERTSALSLDKQNIILEAIRENIIERFCSKDDCRIHFKDVVSEDITLTTPFHIIKEYHMKHHIDEIHSHTSMDRHYHFHTDKQKETIHKHEHKEEQEKQNNNLNLIDVSDGNELNIAGIKLPNFLNPNKSDNLEAFNNLDYKYANF